MSPESVPPEEPDVSRAAPREARARWRPLLRTDRLSAALLVILLGGAVLRLVGDSWGLPLQLHPDEWAIVRGAIDMAQRNSFEPQFFFRPDHVEIKLSYISYVAYAYLLHGASIESVYASDPAPFLLISRTITALFGIAMIVMAYLIGRRLNRVIGVMAAFLVAFFPPYVEHSHYATPDVPLSLTLMIVIYACMRYLDAPSLGNLMVASLGVSLSIAIKYPGALGALIVAVTVAMTAARARRWRRGLAHGAAAAAAVVAFLFVISPVLFTNLHGVVSALRVEARTTHLGADGLGWAGNLGFYADALASSAGIILLASFALSVLWTIRLRLLGSVPLWLGALVWLILSALPLHWARWGLPMYLTPLLVAPIGIYHSARYLRDKTRDRAAARWLPWAAAAAGVTMAANFVAGSVAASAQFVATDTREVSAEYCAAHGIDRTTTISEGYTPQFPDKPAFVFDAFEIVGGRLVPIDSSARHVVLSSSMYGRFQAEQQYASQQEFYALLDAQYPELATFESANRGEPTVLDPVSIWDSLGYLVGVARGGLSGPTIIIYGIPDDPS